MYIPPLRHLLEILIEDGAAESGTIFAYELPDPKQLDKNFTIALLQTGGASNPRYTRDNINLVIQVMGSDRSQMDICRNKIYDLYNALLGRSSFEKDNYTYLQFNSTNMPTFVGYQENSKPLFTCSLSLVRESLVSEGNREPIC